MLTSRPKGLPLVPIRPNFKPETVTTGGNITHGWTRPIVSSPRPSIQSGAMALGVPPKPQARGPKLAQRKALNRQDMGRERTIEQHIKRGKIAEIRDPNEGDCTGPIETVTRYKWDETLLRSTPISDSTPIP